MQQFVSWCLDHLPAIIAAIPTFIQISPIKIYPWTRLFKWIGRTITADVSEEIKEIRTDVSTEIKEIRTDVFDEIREVKKLQTEQQATIDNNEIDRIRFEVLDFANSCRNGRKHTQDEFEHIIVLNRKYKGLLQKTQAENGVFDAEYEYIYEIYRMCQRENKFL